MHTPSFNRVINPVGLLFGAASFLVMRLWMSLCFFPLSGWNNIRLAPSFMLRFGPTPYPGLDGGPITTWIYGPVPLFLNLPATFTHDAITALIIAGAINLLIAIGPVAIVLFAASSPSQQGASWTNRVWALLICLSFWPNSSLQFIQADNTAVAFGLIANFLLLRIHDRSWIHLLSAALCSTLAVWSKQTALGLVLAQVLWLTFTADLRTAIRYTAACATCGLALGGLFVAWFGFDGLWLNLVQLPARSPFCASFLERTITLWPYLVGYVLLPALALTVTRRSIWKRDSVWLLPALTWLCLLPSGLISIYKIGGNANSLNGVLYLLPVAALAFTAMIRSWENHAASALLAIGIIVVTIPQISLSPARSLRPLTEPMHQAEYLAKQFPDKIYFPWFPLVTYFSEHRFYHVEDGLYTRYTAQQEPTRDSAFKNLPPLWSITAFLGPTAGLGIITQLQPPTAQKTVVGGWTVYSWILPDTPAPKL